ncbi:MAG: TIGR02597 family protein [Nibricoccus sp.]
MRPFSQTLALGLALCLCSTTASVAATATTDPVGYNTISLLANSDTYVSVPFSRPAAFVGQISSFSGNVITVAGTPGFTASQFVYASGSQSNTYYAFIRSGAKEGNYYTIIANGTNTLTVDLAGDTLTGIVANEAISIIPYWTLGTLFPASDAGVSFIVTVSNPSPQTQILIPDLTSTGINLSVSKVYRYRSGSWKLVGGLNPSYDDDILIPDSYFIVRNAATGTVFTQTGSVVVKKTTTPLITNVGSKQDNSVALTRPIPVSLNDSGLISSGAFVASNPTGPRTGDELLVVDNTTTGINKSVSAVYFYRNGAWRKVGAADANSDFGATIVFGPGSGVIIRKAATATGASANWTNSPTY